MKSRRATTLTDERHKDTKTQSHTHIHTQAIMWSSSSSSPWSSTTAGPYFHHHHWLRHHHHQHHHQHHRCQKYLDNRSHSGLHTLRSGSASQSIGDFELTSSSVKCVQCQKRPTGDLASFVFLNGPHPLFALLTKQKLLRLIRETRVILWLIVRTRVLGNLRNVVSHSNSVFGFCMFSFMSQ